MKDYSQTLKSVEMRINIQVTNTYSFISWNYLQFCFCLIFCLATEAKMKNLEALRDENIMSVHFLHEKVINTIF